MIRRIIRGIIEVIKKEVQWNKTRLQLHKQASRLVR